MLDVVMVELITIHCIIMTLRYLDTYNSLCSVTFEQCQYLQGESSKV